MERKNEKKEIGRERNRRQRKREKMHIRNLDVNTRKEIQKLENTIHKRINVKSAKSFAN